MIKSARIRQIDLETYHDLAQNGARTLIETFYYKVLDGTKGTMESYFLFYYDEDSTQPDLCFQIIPEVAVDLMAMKYVIKNHSFLNELIEELIEEAMV